MVKKYLPLIFFFFFPKRTIKVLFSSKLVRFDPEKEKKISWKKITN